MTKNGCIIWHQRAVFLTHVLSREYVGLEELTSGVWDVYFGPRRLGVFSESKRRIEEVDTIPPPS